MAWVRLTSHEGIYVKRRQTFRTTLNTNYEFQTEPSGS